MPDPYSELIAQLASTPELVTELLRIHTPTDAGWCRIHHAHRERHPCSIRTLAERAARVDRDDGSATGGPRSAVDLRLMINQPRPVDPVLGRTRTGHARPA